MNELLNLWKAAGSALLLAAVKTTEAAIQKLPHDDRKDISMNNSFTMARKYIKIAAFVTLVLMILFPPKFTSIINPFGGNPMAQDSGYVFLFTDPAAAQKSLVSGLPGADGFVQSGIEWGKLLGQFVVLGVAAFLLLRVTQDKPQIETTSEA